MPVALVVEDEWLLRAALVEEMERAGWTVLEAASGEAAFDIIEGEARIDVLVTDIKLAGVASGWDVAEAFRKSHSDDPVIYASGNAVDAARLVSKSVFVTKPYNSADIVATLSRL
jgi:CheY-like chemotaxis protein